MTSPFQAKAEETILKHCSDGYPVRELLPTQGYKDLVASVAQALAEAEQRGAERVVKAVEEAKLRTPTRWAITTHEELKEIARSALKTE